MRFNKDVIYHFSCEKCYNSWSYPVTDRPNRFDKTKTWYCPHCSYEHKSPHVDKADEPDITLKDLRELV